MTFTVKHEKFEGPLELLLDLIEKRKMHVSDVSLSKVADDFVAYVQAQTEFPVGQSAQFVLVASTLLLIKSKSLLPQLNLTTEEQASIDDLEKRLRLYERMKALAQGVKPMFGAQVMFPRGDRKQEAVFSPDADMTVPNLFDAVRRVLQNLPKKEFLPKVVVDKVISLEEMITSLTSRVTESLRMSFRDFSRGAGTSGGQGGSGEGRAVKVNVIVSFLAMLELVKQGVISVTQDKHFEDIQMETENLGTPRY